jgi:ribosomal protein S18 acetylase RimI-like enzyme
LSFKAYNTRIEKYVGVVVCKIDAVNESSKSQNTDEDLPCKGYIAMLAVDEGHRGLGIGTKLVEKVITRMHNIGCDEVNYCL